MEKIYKGQVNQLRSGLINQITLMFINPDDIDIEIEFNESFQIWTTANLLFSDEIMKVMDTITGVRMVDGEFFLTGVDYNKNQFDDMELEEIWDLYELAHILDALTTGHYKILSNG